jgi:L-malate glycosyltransferase
VGKDLPIENSGSIKSRTDPTDGRNRGKNDRILYLANASEIHTKRWVRHFESKGFRIPVLSMDNHDTERLHVRPIAGGGAKWAAIKQALEVRRVVHETAPLFVHAHYAGRYGLLGALAGFHPYVLSVWGSDVYDFPRLSTANRLVTEFIFRRADIICATSHALATEVRKYTDKSVSITPFGVDCSIYTDISRSKRRSSDKIVIGTVKKMDHPYGIDALIKAFSKVARSSPKISMELRLAGDGPLLEKLKSLAAELGVADRVRFYGRIPQTEVPTFLRGMDVYVALSVSESFGVAVLEASACGLPVVVTDVGGLPEVVKQGETGFIVPAGSIEGAAIAIERLVCDPELRSAMGARGREFVIQEYEWGKTALHMEAVYQRVAGK